MDMIEYIMSEGNYLAVVFKDIFIENNQALHSVCCTSPQLSTTPPYTRQPVVVVCRR